MSGRPYETFLYELNLPNSVGAVFVAGTPDNLGKTEKYYKKLMLGIFLPVNCVLYSAKR